MLPQSNLELTRFSGHAVSILKCMQRGKMSIINFTKIENDWKRWPEVELVTGNVKFRVLAAAPSLMMMI